MDEAAVVDRAHPVDARVPAARALRRRLRSVRRTHHTGSLGDALTDLYTVALIVALYGGTAPGAIRDLLASPGVQAADAGARYWVAVAAVLAAAGLAWHGLRTVGPLLVTPASQSWVFGTPVDRAGLLRPRFGGLVAGAAAGAGAAGLAAGYAGGAGAAGLAWSAGAGIAAGVTGAALGVVAQASGRVPRWTGLLTRALVAGGIALALVGVAGGACPPGVALCGAVVPPPLSMSLTAIATLVMLPVALVATVHAGRSLGRVERAALTGGAELASAAASAAIMLDPSMFTRLAENRRWRSVAKVPGRPLPGRPGRWWPRWAQRFQVLVRADLRRRLRDRFALGAWAALLLVMYAIAVALPPLEGPAHVVLAYLAADRLTGGLRAISRSPGLRRVLGGHDRELRLAHLVVPAAGATVWYLTTLPAVAPFGMVDLALILGVVLAAYRTATRQPVRYGGPAAETPFGMIPFDLIRQVLRGPDVVAVLVVVAMLVR